MVPMVEVHLVFNHGFAVVRGQHDDRGRAVTQSVIGREEASDFSVRIGDFFVVTIDVRLAVSDPWLALVCDHTFEVDRLRRVVVKGRGLGVDRSFIRAMGVDVVQPKKVGTLAVGSFV